MKKSLSKFILGMFMSVLLIACGSKNEKKGESVIVSNYPMYTFTKMIAGDSLEIINLVPPGTEPHDWEPSVKDIANLEEAKAFIYNGAGMEPWVNKVLSSLGNKKLVTLEASKGVELIELEGHDEEEEHHHNHHKEHHHEHHHHHGKWDPHVFLSLRGAQIELLNIKNVLQEINPKDRELYQSNYEKAVNELKALDREYTKELSPYQGGNIVVAHEAFGYLCRDYNLNQIGIEEVFADSEPSPAKMKEIIDFVREHKVKVIFFESLASPKVANAIAKETGVRTDMLNPLEGLTQEEIDRGENYFSIMKKNLKALKEALE